MSSQGTATIDFGTPANPAPKVYYFHTDTSLNGSTTAATGCTTLSETVPDATDAAAASIAGGHQSTASGVESSLLNKPLAKDITEVPGMPPRVDMPLAAHQFGWFSDLALTGFFAKGVWTFQWREDDDGAGIGGNPIVNIFASSTRDFTGTMRVLGQVIGNTDWWAGGANTNTWQSTNTFPDLTLNNEYFFVQVWCHETVLLAGRTLTFHQEGSDLTDATRSLLKTPQFLPTGYLDSKTVTVTGQTGIVSTTHVEAFFMSADSTTDSTTDDHDKAASRCDLVCGNIVANTSFDITARPNTGMMIGQFKVRWVWN